MEMQTTEYGGEYAAAADGARVALRRERDRERERDKGLKGIFETLSRRRGRLSRLLAVSMAASTAPAAGAAEPAPVPIDYSSAPTNGQHTLANAACTAIRVVADQHILPVPHAAPPYDRQTRLASPKDHAGEWPLATPPTATLSPAKSAARDRSCDWGSEFSDSDTVDTDPEADTIDLAGQGQYAPLPAQSLARCDANTIRLTVATASTDGHCNARHPYLQAVSTDRLLQPLPAPPHPAFVDEQHQPGYACPDDFAAPECQHDHVEENIYELPDEQKAALAASIIHGWHTSDSVLIPEDPDVDFLPASHSVTMSSVQANTKASTLDNRWQATDAPQHTGGPLRCINYRPQVHNQPARAQLTPPRPASLAADTHPAAVLRSHSGPVSTGEQVYHQGAVPGYNDIGTGRTTTQGPGAGRQVAARLNQLLAARLSVPDQSSTGSSAAAHALPTRKASLPATALHSLSGQSTVSAVNGAHAPTMRAGSITPGQWPAPSVAVGRGPGAAEHNSDTDATYTDTRQRPAVPPKPQTGECLWPRTEADPLDVFPWYHGNIDRAESGRRLLRTGTEGAFLVRRSVKGSQRFASPYSLSLNSAGRIYHLTIRRRPDGCFALGFEKAGEQAFASVEEMVDAHVHQPIHLAECERAVLLVMVLTKSVFC